MRAIQVPEYGGSENLVPGEVPVPDPGPGEVRVRLSHAGVNFIDVYVRKGTFRHSVTYANTPPFTPGMEGGGTVDALGEGVTDLAEGQRVAWCLQLGSYAEYAVVPAWKCVPVPDDVSMDLGVTCMLQGSTAHYLTHSLFPLQAGQSCLVHAGAGGMGQLLVQIAKMRGATVFATVGSAEKAEIVKALGADHAILYREVDFAEAVLDATDGQGVNVVYDSVGKDTIMGSLKCCARRGVVSNNGNASGAIECLNPLDLAEAGSVFFTRPHLADYVPDAEQRRGRAADLFDWVRGGQLKVAIDRSFPLADARLAHDYIEAGRTKGKLLLEI